jgi:transposase
MKDMSMSATTEATITAIGVGLDTARYGHHVSFLNEDRSYAATPFDFLESRSGYQRLEKAFQRLADKHANVHFQIRVDAAGQYATNLLAFLHKLPWPKTVSVGEPTRNKRYRQVHFPKRKADATESHACARFAIVERPGASPRVTPEVRALQEVASRLEFQVKRSTREVNRLHNLLGRVFPELATLQNDLQVRWLLRLLDKYPTAERIAKARRRSLTAIPHLNAKKATQLQEAAKESVAAEQGAIVEELVRASVHSLAQSLDAEKRLENLLLEAFEAVPDKRIKQIATIHGIGQRTAAILVAKIGSIERFPTADHLTSYFGVFPEENTSGLDKYGNPVPPGTMRMSRKGNDLVRKHLWMAALSAISCNPQVKALYARLRARGRRGDVALGHCMRKLLHQVFGIWTTGQAYDPNYRPMEKPASCGSDAPPAVDEKKAAGRKTGISPQRKAVTATASTIEGMPQTVNQPAGIGSLAGDVPSGGSIDFSYLRSQITLERVLRHVGYFDRLRGRGPQRRGPCPVHGTKRDRGRTFSVHLGKNVCQCFHPPCGASGNVLDLWCQIHQLTTYEGAILLAKTFDLELHPDQRRGTRNRNP